MGVRIMASSASLGCGEIESLEPPIKRTRRSDSPNLTSSEGFGTFKGSSDGPTTSQDDTGSSWYLPSSEKSAENSFQYQGGTSTIASSEENDLDREAAGDSGFSDGMATPPTSNCDDVSQDSSGAFSFNQNTNSSSTNNFQLTTKSSADSRKESFINGNSAPYQGSSPFRFSDNKRLASPKQPEHQSERQSSTEDEEPLVPIDPSDLIHLFPDADNAQYHDGLTDSDAGSTSSDSFDGDDTNGIRHSTNSDRSPEPSTSAYVHSYATSNNKASDTNEMEKANGEENEDDDDDDRLSVISGISELSGAEWKPTAGPFAWAQNQMMRGTDPRDLLKDMISADSVIPAHLDQLTLWKIVLNMVAEPPRRKKLSNVNTLEDVVRLIRTSKKIIVLTGAGVSVSCGIPDFRSRDGVYARLAVDFPDLPDPQAMFDIHYFRKDPRPFFKFAREIYPGQFKPSPCHSFIRSIEKHGKLLRNYTQNIDTLEQVAGIERAVQCHGSFATATCTVCKYKVQADDIKEDIFQQRIPYCPKCNNGSTEDLPAS